MTNILPQTPDLNQGPWLKFEYFCESLCKDSLKELYVISGGIYHTNTRLSSSDKVAVPDSCWKIVVVLNPGQKIEDITMNNYIYAVCMPNIAGIRSASYKDYYTTVNAIEASTGYDFLSEIQDSIEDMMETELWYK